MEIENIPPTHATISAKERRALVLNALTDDWKKSVKLAQLFGATWLVIPAGRLTLSRGMALSPKSAGDIVGDAIRRTVRSRKYGTAQQETFVVNLIPGRDTNALAAAVQDWIEDFHTRKWELLGVVDNSQAEGVVADTKLFEHLLKKV